MSQKQVRTIWNILLIRLLYGIMDLFSVVVGALLITVGRVNLCGVKGICQ